MKKRDTTHEDFVTIRLYKYDENFLPSWPVKKSSYSIRKICPFKTSTYDTSNACEYAYTGKCYTCDISKFAYEKWRNE